MLLAETYAMLENNEEALKAIKDGITRDEFEKEYYLFAGKISLKLGRVKEAETLFTSSNCIRSRIYGSYFHSCLRCFQQKKEMKN